MSNIEKNALRIAELIGNNRVNGTNAYEKVIQYTGVTEWLCREDDATAKTFSSYNGLMPIVFECNQGNYGITINWSVRLADKTSGKTLYYSFQVGLRTESEFIEAIQLACIKYLELKNGE